MVPQVRVSMRLAHSMSRDSPKSATLAVMPSGAPYDIMPTSLVSSGLAIAGGKSTLQGSGPDMR